jgi:hypothetical protein
MTWPGLTRNVQSFYKTCKLCHFYKKPMKQYGKIPLKVVEATPWEILQDPATSWPEICEITDERSQTVMDVFQNNWLWAIPDLCK